MNASVHHIVERENERFRENIFQRHQGIDGMLRANYKSRARAEGAAAANRQLLNLDERLQLPGSCFSASMDDDAIKALAKARAGNCEGIHLRAMKSGGGVIADSAYAVGEFVESCSIPFPLKITSTDTPDTIAQKELGAIARACCPKWWRRQLRKQSARQVEAELRGLGFVQKQKAPYVSEWAFKRWQEGQGRNANTLGRLEAVNEEGEAVALLDCIESSISNPVNRRNELMTRMRGYEEVATGLGLVGLFFTLTTPSRYHAMRSKGGVNPAFEGATPRDAMGWLNDTWALIRSAWHREGLRAFGFRVSEPHHDGTPHCHFLLFVSPEEQARACGLFGQYALADTPNEPGAQENRWDVKAIDPAKGSAAGYLAKYVAKNVDGYRVGIDEEGEVLADEGAARVRAWASLWGIRQFQPIGSVSVTVWRELRRRTDPLEDWEPEQVEAIRAAADAGDWAAFVELMGGAFVARDEQTVRPCYLEAEEKPNQYGEAVKRLIGVWLRPVAKAIGRAVSTREHVWQIRERAQAREQVAAQPPPLDLCQ